MRPTPGDPRGAEQHHWNTGANENQQLIPGGPSNRQKTSGPNQLKQVAQRATIAHLRAIMLSTGQNMLFLPCNPSGQVFLVTIYIWLNIELYQDWQIGLRDIQVHKCGQMDSCMKRQTLDQSHTFSSHCQPMARELKTKIDFFL